MKILSYMVCCFVVYIEQIFWTHEPRLHVSARVSMDNIPGINCQSIRNALREVTQVLNGHCFVDSYKFKLMTV